MKFEMTDEQYNKIIAASQPVRCMMIGGVVPSSPQENANRAWQALGKEMGFDYFSVRPYGKDTPKMFTANELK